MHDGQINTLNKVIELYSDGVKPFINIDSKMKFVHLGGANPKIENQKNNCLLKTTFQ